MGIDSIAEQGIWVLLGYMATFFYIIGVDLICIREEDMKHIIPFSDKFE